MNIAQAEAFVTQELRQRLSPTLHYHGLHHTYDVVAQSREIALAEGISDPTELALLHTAALFHDAGFIHVYGGHEALGCDLARQTLPALGYDEDHLQVICTCIMATKIPQEAPTHLAQILCDADLDYLGREDFYPISATLFDELAARQMIASQTAWDEIQVRFMSAHHYHTATNQARREAHKQARIAEIRASLAERVPQ